MAFTRADEHQILADTLRRFLRDHNSPGRRLERLKELSPRTSLALWRGLADLGILGAAFREEDGGLGGDARTLAIIAAELGSALALEPFLHCAIVAGYLLQRTTRADERARAVQEIMSGQRIIVMAHEALARPTLRASREGKHVELHGSVRWAYHADLAEEYLVVADDGKQILVLRIPAALAGLSRESNRLMDDTFAADLHFRDVRVPASAELSFDEPAEQVVADALERASVFLAAETVGIVNALNRDTFQYLGTRKQFGVAIGTFQALQHRAADMYMAARGLESVVELAIDAIDTPRSPARSSLASAAKAEADRVGTIVGHEAIQMHGGMGVSDELVISHYGRRLATIRTQFGSADRHRLRFGAL